MDDSRQFPCDAGRVERGPDRVHAAGRRRVQDADDNELTGLGGTIGLNTLLGTDGSPSDKLVISGGAATGGSSLRITNAGGPGPYAASNGILVVEAMNGGVTSPGAFALSGVVEAGPFEYRLFRGGLGGDAPNDWFLRNEFVTPPVPPEPPTPPEPPGPPQPPGPPGPPAPPTPLPPNPLPPAPPPDPLPPNTAFPIIGPQLATYGVAQPLARQMGLAALGTLHERIGDTYGPDCAAPASAPETSGVDLPTASLRRRKSRPRRRARCLRRRPGAGSTARR